MNRLIYSKVNPNTKKKSDSNMSSSKKSNDISYPEFKVPNQAESDTLFEQSLLTEIINARLAPSSFIKDFEVMKKMYEGKIMKKKKF